MDDAVVHSIFHPSSCSCSCS